MGGINKITDSIPLFLIEIVELSYFTIRFFKAASKPPIEFREFLRQCVYIRNRSLFLVDTTGFIIGLFLHCNPANLAPPHGFLPWLVFR